MHYSVLISKFTYIFYHFLWKHLITSYNGNFNFVWRANDVHSKSRINKACFQSTLKLFSNIYVKPKFKRFQGNWVCKILMKDDDIGKVSMLQIFSPATKKQKTDIADILIDIISKLHKPSYDPSINCYTNSNHLLRILRLR